jgi:hypothetical protein
VDCLQVVHQVETVLEAVKSDPYIKRLWDYAPLEITDAMPASSATASQRNTGQAADDKKMDQSGVQLHVTPGKITSSSAMQADAGKDIHVASKDQGVDA